jgi:starch-binding outer membrane protein, SusD/RagB family
MNNMQRIRTVIVICIASALVAGCKDDFLEEKRDLTGINEEVFENESTAIAYVDYVYGLFQPASNSSNSFYWSLAVGGDNLTRTTEELSGQTEINRPWTNIAFHQAHALPYFGNRLSSSISNNTWTRIRQINIFLAEIDNHGLSEEVTSPLKGQMYFWRAFQYFDLLRLYGGVPLVLEPQDPVGANGVNLEVPRSSSSETLAQVISDLDEAIRLLPGEWDTNNWGRITRGAAAALKGRALLTWASPLFNRNDEQARWQQAYEANLAAKNLLEENGFGLFKTGSLANAEAWGNMWFTEVNNPEAVIVYGFNNSTTDQLGKNNYWEYAARSTETNGNGSISPTKQMVDAFPMKDGRYPGSSNYSYDEKKFYKNRDPRFYKTFAYNGARWPYRENPNFVQWSYRWYNATANVAGNPNQTTEKQGANASGIYLAKATNPNASNVDNFSISGTDVMELRFAEVVLNLAESAIGIGQLNEGKQLITTIRERAGVENLDGSYGLTEANSRDQLFKAVLDERRVEFAYEGKRFWDLRRWMLFDESSPTVARLGMQGQTLNGTRRTGYFIIAKNADGSRYQGDSDPLLASASGAAPVINREPSTYPPGITTFEQYVDYLYDNHFEIVEKDDLDPINPAGWVFSWYDQYYFFGLSQTIMNSSPYLEQTKGWNGLSGAGTFDPLL